MPCRIFAKGRLILANSLVAAWRSYRRRRGIAHELTTLLLGIVAGLVVMPLGIYVCGQVLLGGYLRSPAEPAHAGPWAFFSDYLAGISGGSMPHWLILVGPYVTYLIFRIGRGSSRA
jgi:hypothetical protein